MKTIAFILVILTLSKFSDASIPCNSRVLLETESSHFEEIKQVIAEKGYDVVNISNQDIRTDYDYKITNKQTYGHVFGWDLTPNSVYSTFIDKKNKPVHLDYTEFKQLRVSFFSITFKNKMLKKSVLLLDRCN